MGRRKPRPLSRPEARDSFHRAAAWRGAIAFATSDHARRRCGTSAWPRLQQQRRATAPPECGGGTFPRQPRAEGVARSHDCRHGIAMARLVVRA
jgi:hypothetical protein